MTIQRWSIFNLRRGVCFAVALSLAPIALAHDVPGAVNIPASQLPTADRQLDIALTAHDFETPFDWENYSARARVVEEAEVHSAFIKEEIARQLAKLGEAAFLAKVEADKAAWDFPGWGKGEVTRIDGIFHARVVHAETGVSFYFVERGEVASESKHLRKIVARQHIDAGDKRPNGSKQGRDTLIAWTEGHRVVEEHYYPRNPILSPAWVEDYWLATYSTPTRAEHAFGVFCAAFQVGAASCLLGIKSYLDPSADFDTSVLMMSALWGYGIGAYNSTYRNLIYRGSERSKFIKMWTQSMLFAWSLYIYSEGVWTLINVTAPAFYQVHGNAVINSWLHNQGRRAWYLFPEVRSFHRDAIGTRKILGWDTGVKNASIEQQAIYLVPYTIKLAGLVGMGTIATLSLGGEWAYKLDGGTVALLASVPLAQLGAVAYARHRNYPNAGDYAEEFRNYWSKMGNFVQAGLVGYGYLNGITQADQLAAHSRAALQWPSGLRELPANIAGWMARAGLATLGAAKTCAATLLGLSSVD